MMHIDPYIHASLFGLLYNSNISKVHEMLEWSDRGFKTLTSNLAMNSAESISWF
jgi:hypothetical protein